MSILVAARIICGGGLVIFPTETVYGIGADATNIEAVEKIFVTKNRPSHNPLIIHCYDLNHALIIGDFSDIAIRIAKELWPGPLSLVVRLKNNIIAPNAMANLSTVCIRVPKHPLAHDLIKLSGKYIAAPSANVSNYISPTQYQHVVSAFPDIYAIDGGQCLFGLESTILDVSTEQIKILRHGFITSNTIQNILDRYRIKLCENIENEFIVNRAPGALNKHYAPYAKIRINACTIRQNEVGLNFGNSRLAHDGSLNLSISGDLIEASANLYLMLRLLDDAIASSNSLDTIAVAAIPNIGIGVAINDRLKRAGYNEKI